MTVNPGDLSIGDILEYSDYYGKVTEVERDRDRVKVEWRFTGNDRVAIHDWYPNNLTTLWNQCNLREVYDPSITPVIRKIRKMWERQNYVKRLHSAVSA